MDILLISPVTLIFTGGPMTERVLKGHPTIAKGERVQSSHNDN